jgi:hypothetical protein
VSPTTRWVDLLNARLTVQFQTGVIRRPLGESSTRSRQPYVLQLIAHGSACPVHLIARDTHPCH